MYTLFVILIVIAAVLMIGIVLIQESKGGGLSSSFAGYNQVAGVRKTTDFIEKATWGLAAAMVVAPTTASDASVMENIENPVTNPNNLPGFGASQQKEDAQPAATDKAAEAPAAEAPAAEAPAAEAPAQPAN